MRILHVSLDDPFMHSGGLNIYCRDLMNAERQLGHSVLGLYAGSQISLKKRIKRIRDDEFTVVGALPKALTYGVKMAHRYMKKIKTNIYLDFLFEIKPDIIHIHSIMGIHKEFFEAAKQLGIAMIFTTHDYYPLCFRCTFTNNEGRLCSKPSDFDCYVCNINSGISIIEQFLISSKAYAFIKNIVPIVFMKRIFLKNRLSNAKENVLSFDYRRLAEYTDLKKYYSEILKLIHNIHCNSNLARDLYASYDDTLDYYVKHITRRQLETKQHIRNKILRLSFFGGFNYHKGYFVLVEALKKIETIPNWSCSMYGYGLERNPIDYSSGKIMYQGYCGSMKKAWESTDILIVPSQCPETFGFVVMEALVQGIPVICSDIVGAKELLRGMEENSVFFHADSDALAELIQKYIDRNYYDVIVKRIRELPIVTNMNCHAQGIVNIYKGILNDKENIFKNYSNNIEKK